MLGIGLGVSLGVGTILRLVKSFNQSLEYWETFEGERVFIRSQTTDRHPQPENGESQRLNQTAHIIEGEVAEILSAPPGFMLRDVHEVIRLSDLRVHGAAEDPTYTFVPDRQGMEHTRQVEQKFVAFDAIEEIEFAEDDDGNQIEFSEPFRQRFREKAADTDTNQE